MTVKAVSLGIFLAFVFGSANAYLGMKAGQTVAATIPAAVIAMALFRIPAFRGGILEQNITRTAASVGEALVAGAIFTIPAFMMVDIGGQRCGPILRSHYWEATLVILLVGGLIGVFFIILLRRPLCVDAPLPWPESVASYEIVKAGEASASQSSPLYFRRLGFGGLIEILTDDKGAQIFREYVEGFLKFPRSVIQHFDSKRSHRRRHAFRRHPLVHAQPLAGAHRHRLHHRTRAFLHQCRGRHHRLVDPDPAAAVLRSRSAAPHRDQRSRRSRQFGLVQRGAAHRGGHHAGGRGQHHVFHARVAVEFAARDLQRFHRRGHEAKRWIPPSATFRPLGGALHRRFC
jgi:hypothetical protein